MVIWGNYVPCFIVKVSMENSLVVRAVLGSLLLASVGGCDAKSPDIAALSKLTTAPTATQQPLATNSASANVMQQSESELLTSSIGLKLLDDKGNAIRTPKEDWPKARALLRDDAGWKQWLVGRQAALDAWMAKPRDRVDMIPGNGFKLLDPVTKAPIAWTVDMPEPDRAIAGGDFWRAWVSRTRSHNLSRIQEAAYIYRATGDTKYRDWAIQQIDFYAQNYRRWPIQRLNGLSQMLAQGLDEATAVAQLIDALRLFGNEIPTTKLTIWRGNLFYPIAINLQQLNQGVNNIAVWHASAIAMIALQFNDEAMLSSALDGKAGINQLLSNGITADYLWFEGSFSYNQYVVQALAPLMTFAAFQGKTQRVYKPMLVAQNLLLAPFAFRFPDGMLPTVGDTRGRQSALSFGGLSEVARVLPTHYGINEFNRSRSWGRLLDSALPMSSTVPAMPEVRTQLFDPSRFALLKNDSWQAFVHFGHLTAAHAQPDAPGYELYFESQPVAADPGTVDYGSPWHEQYFRRGVAHNMPLINGEGQPQALWNAGKVIAFDPKQPSIVVRQDQYMQDASLQRSFRLDENTFIDKTELNLTGPSTALQRLGQVFNTNCKIVLPPELANSFKPAAAPLGTGFAYWTNVELAVVPSRWQVKLQCGDELLQLQVDAQYPHRLFRASAPTTPLPQRREVLYLEIDARQLNVEMKINKVIQ